jgi:Flp pilus assembly protein TadB
MYIIAIAWLYVTVLMATTEKSVTAGILTLVFYGLLPCAILLWVLGVKHRKFKRKFNQKFKSAVNLNNEHLLNDGVREPDGANAKTDE